MKSLVVKTEIKAYMKKEGHSISLKAFETLNDRVAELLDKAMIRAELHQVKVVKGKHL